MFHVKVMTAIDFLYIYHFADVLQTIVFAVVVVCSFFKLKMVNAWYSSSTLILQEVTSCVRVICTPDYCLLSHSKQPHIIYNSATCNSHGWIACIIQCHQFLAPITKTYQYNFDPLKPHFYIVKLSFTGLYIILFLLKKLRLWVLVRTA